VIVDELYGRELGGHPPISSTAIRAALREGRVRDAAAMLGRPHRLSGRVGVGHGRGAGLGVATANLERIAQMRPGDAVYSAVGQTASGDLWPAAVNIGPQPTFAGEQSCVEAHLIGASGDFRGQLLGIHLLERLRGQQKFDSPAALVQQIRLDLDAARSHAAAALADFRASPPIDLPADD
jgi:riboflavin kinase / FMN adenylyltransferase